MLVVQVAEGLLGFDQVDRSPCLPVGGVSTSPIQDIHPEQPIDGSSVSPSQQLVSSFAVLASKQRYSTRCCRELRCVTSALAPSISFCMEVLSDSCVRMGSHTPER